MATKGMTTDDRQMSHARGSSRRDAGSKSVARSHPGERPRFWLVVAILVVCLVGGGSSWETSLSLLYLRPLLILLCAVLLMLPGRAGGTALRGPMLLLLVFAAAVALQLVPLPPAWWRAVPGREPYWDAVRLAGQADLWRPISVSPDRTINSILALLPAAAVLLGAGGLGRRRLEDLVPVLVAMIMASAVLGVVQWSGAGYLYKQASVGFPTGFFANRNHQAVFLSLTFPLLRLWYEIAQARGQARPWHGYGAMALGLFLVAIIVTSGSRAGLVATVIALLASVFLVPFAGWQRWSRTRRRQVAVAGVVSMAFVGALFLFGRAVSVDRLTDADNYTAELRVRFFPLLIDLVHRFGWAGSGFGTFDEVFRGIEPDWALKPTFFNRAHNEVLETAITGGIAALAAVSVFLLWFLRHLFRAWCGIGRIIGYEAGQGTGKASDVALARLGSVVVLLLLLASLVDYPLRTPLLGAVLALAVAWLASGSQQREIGRQSTSQFA